MIIQNEDSNISIPINKSFDKKEIIIGIRPDKLSYNPIKGGIKIPVVCDYTELLGHDLYGYAFIGEQRISIKLPKVKIEPEQKFDIFFNPESFFFFDKETGERI